MLWLVIYTINKVFLDFKKERINEGGGVISDSQPGFKLKYYDIPWQHSNHWYT